MLRFDLPQVSANAIRLDAFITFLVSAAALLGAPAVLAWLVFVGLVRGFFGHHRCVGHQASKFILNRLERPGRAEDAGPKSFAAKMLFAASSMAFVLWISAVPIWRVPAAALLVFSFLEWAMAFCAGCWMYALWHKLRPAGADSDRR